MEIAIERLPIEERLLIVEQLLQSIFIDGAEKLKNMSAKELIFQEIKKIRHDLHVDTVTHDDKSNDFTSFLIQWRETNKHLLTDDDT